MNSVDFAHTMLDARKHTLESFPNLRNYLRLFVSGRKIAWKEFAPGSGGETPGSRRLRARIKSLEEAQERYFMAELELLDVFLDRKDSLEHRRVLKELEMHCAAAFEESDSFNLLWNA